MPHDPPAKTYCEGCHIQIAPHDPERLTRDGLTWHQNCHRKHLAKAQPPQQLAFPFLGSLEVILQ